MHGMNCSHSQRAERPAPPAPSQARFFGVYLGFLRINDVLSLGPDLDAENANSRKIAIEIRVKARDAVAHREIEINPERARLTKGRRRGTCPGQGITFADNCIGCYHMLRAEILKVRRASCQPGALFSSR